MLKHKPNSKNFPHSILLLFSIFILIGSLGSADAPEYATYYASDYNILNGTYLSGGVPASIQGVDSDYFIVRSSGTATSTTAYNPSGCSLLGSTTLVSGTTADLVSDNGNYMTFRSYASASSPTAKTNAFIAYRDSTTTLNTPKERTWTGDTALWSSQSEMATSDSSVRFTRVAYSPIEHRSLEKVVVTLSTDGYLDAFVFDGASWNVTNDIGFIGTTANAYKSFDIAYETTSGEALLVYSIAPATNFRVGYKTWSFDSGWSGENIYVIDSGTAQTAYWISMASKPKSGANEIAVGVIGDSTSLEAYGLIWNGTAQTSGYVTFVSSTGNDAFSWQWSGSVWDASATTFDLSGASTPNWFTLKANHINDELFAVCVDGDSGLNTAYWNGSAWTLHVEHDAAVDTNARRPADFDWESTGSKGLLVWGTSSGQIAYKTYVAPNTWGTQQNPAMGANIHPWVQLRSNPRSINGDVKILGAVLEGVVFDLGTISWDGTTFTVIGTNTISSDTTTTAYESFELEFMRFGLPTEFTCDIEFTGTSNTQSWTQLVWTIESSFTITNVTTTFQQYNYETGLYPASGDGYMTATAGTTDVTKTQIITINSTYFRDASGNWKIRVKGVKTTTTQFDFKVDWIEFKPTYYSEYTVSTEFLFSSMTTNTPTQLNFTVVSEYDIASVSVTIQVWNYAFSAYVTSGEGYLTYTSSGSNETKLLSINTNPQFYASNGNAKIKIAGVLATPTQFRQEINQVKLLYSYDIHDVSVVSVTASASEVTSGQVVSVIVLVRNNGTVIETFNVTVFRNETALGTKTVTNLTPGNQITLEFIWNTTNVNEATYRIRAVASAVPSETDTNNNAYTGGIVKVSKRTSLLPFDWVIALLYALPVIVGLLFLLVLKLKRKKKTKPYVEKKTDAFSQQFGMSHQQMIGKKMLLEIDPTSDYNNALSSFVSEAKKSNELLFILTNKNSTLHSAFSGASNVKFLLLTSKTSSPQRINENETLLPASDLSIQLDAFVRIQKSETEKTINMLFDNLSDIILRCGFEKTYKFTRFLLEAISSPKTTALFLFNPMAHEPFISSSIRGLFQIQLAYAKTGPKVGTL